MQQESSTTSIPGFERRLPRGWLSMLLASLLAASIGAAFLNLSMATLRRADGLVSWERILLALASAVVVSLLIHLVLSLVTVTVTRWTHRRRFIPLVIWSDLTVLAIATLAPVWDLVSDNLPHGGWAPAERLMISSAIWATALTVPLIGGVAAAAWRRKRRIARTYQAWLLTAPLLGFQVFVFVWTQVHWVSGIVSARSLWVSLVFLLGTMTTLAAGTWLSQHVRALPALGSAVALILLAPVLGLLAADRPSSATPATSGDDAAATSCVVLLTVDTLRADTLEHLISEPSATGESTSNLATLMDDSMVFDRARSSAPWTKPAAASILTGLAPEVHGATGIRSLLPSTARTLAEYLQAEGFTTAGIGHNTFLRHGFNFDQGFDDYNFFPRGNSGILGDRFLRSAFPRTFATEPTSEELTDFAIHWLGRHAEQRFFLWLHYFDPHGPFTPAPSYLPTAPAPPRIGTSFAQAAAVRSGELVPDLAERAWIEELYLAEARQVSTQVGRVIDRLKSLERYDSCLVVFTSDHGEEFWEHGGFEHGHTLYDELLRVPLAFKLPATVATAPRRLPGPVSTTSVTPTLLDLLAIDAPEAHFSAPSVASHWRPSETPTDSATATPVFASGVHYFEDRDAVVFGDYKYIRVPLTGQRELFHIAEDADESTTLHLAEDDIVREAERLLMEHAERSRQLRSALGIAGSQLDLDAKTLQELRSLGYLQ